MKIAVLSDLHFISESDPRKDLLEKRRFFADAWPSFRELTKKIREESPDLVISTGDLVDWYSEENRDFALELLAEMKLPWEAVPGNHDYTTYYWDETEQGHVQSKNGESEREADQGWQERGITLGNRVIDAAGTKLLLMNSAFSGVPEGTEEWLQNEARDHSANILFTHVPVNVPTVRDYILSVDPQRDMGKYIQSKAPGLFEQCIRGRIPCVYTGHLHFPGTLEVEGTTMRMLGLSIVALNRSLPGMGRAAVFHTERPDDVRMITGQA